MPPEYSSIQDMLDRSRIAPKPSDSYPPTVRVKEKQTLLRPTIEFPVDDRDKVIKWADDNGYRIVRSGPKLTGPGRCDKKLQLWVMETEH